MEFQTRKQIVMIDSRDRKQGESNSKFAIHVGGNEIGNIPHIIEYVKNIRLCNCIAPYAVKQYPYIILKIKELENINYATSDLFSTSFCVLFRKTELGESFAMEANVDNCEVFLPKISKLTFELTDPNGNHLQLDNDDNFLLTFELEMAMR